MTETRTYRVIKDARRSMGGFMCPPGHWNHFYALEEYTSPRGRKVISSSTIEHALDPHSGATESVRNRVRRIIDGATLVCSELWVRNVYGYFKGMYVPESGKTDASSLLSVWSLAGERVQTHLATLPAEQVKDLTRAQRTDMQAEFAAEIRAEMSPERHAAAAFVRQYFPDHKTRLDLIADPGKGYGSYPCAKCDKRVQYEARVDALAVFGEGNGHVCPEGGSHEH